MSNSVQLPHPDQSFADDERLFRRVRRHNLKPDGKPSLLAFELPDMSVNRERFSTAEDARRGFDSSDWGVVSFLVRDIPPRETWRHIIQVYSRIPRHIPMSGNFAHAEVRVRRIVDAVLVLITSRKQEDFDEGDPDRDAVYGLPNVLLDPDFHMRWRKHLALAAKPAAVPMVLLE